MINHAKKRQILVLLAIVIILALGLAIYYSKVATKATHDEIPKTQPIDQGATSPSQAQKDVLKFAAMGDMLAHDSIVAQAKTPSGYDFKSYFNHIRSFYRDADVVFCNPETLTAGEAFGISGYPVFNGPTEFARDLVLKDGAGCDIINLATNHMNDKGQAAIDANLAEWDKLKPLAYSGANRSLEEQQTVRYFTQNGIKVAFLAFADYSNDKNLTSYGVNIYHDTALVQRLLKTARTNADAVIVSAHWGTEDATTVNPDQLATAQLFADSGADVIIGTGPHVLQKVDYLAASDGRKVLVWYSIGNMLSSQLKANELTGVVAGFTLTKQKVGSVVVSGPKAHITYMSYDWPAADRVAQRLEARTNLQLRPLEQAGDSMTAMFGSEYSPSERKVYVRSVLSDGQPSLLNITPE